MSSARVGTFCSKLIDRVGRNCRVKGGEEPEVTTSNGATAVLVRPGVSNEGNQDAVVWCVVAAISGTCSA